MISIIICSANKQYLIAVKESIAKTIGCEYEILAYDNAKGERGICEVYNQSAAEARYNVLCFMHEDIAYKTQDWGKIILRVFSENPSLGLLGIAGGDYKSLAPSSWFNFGDSEGFRGKYYLNLLQGKELRKEIRNPNKEKLSKVACLDGVWLCTTKEVFSKVKFDETMLKGFHGYDIDYSLAVNNIEMGVFVTHEILLHHFSEGKYDKSWFTSIKQIHNKWSYILPINYANLSSDEIFILEKRMFRQFFIKYLDDGYSKKEMIEILISSKRSRVMTLNLFIKVLFSILKFHKKSKPPII
ncbi:glycosyltransferase [Algoriphagus sp. NG3]|uniref:glycosyltransferase n=1 Tax=Algoriphagus sp. NG3 TaxID=3097546 RepID=UPI002A824EA6|nr:glycosyltransferase [Algoriphagus sp. NG3]WPR76164.1 glycosyltransferase [Algoriphagus sp. NG3]